MKTPMVTLIAASLARAWTRLYTAGLPPRVREARRHEVESDLWESLQDASRCGERPLRTASHMLARLVLGWVDDLSWRLEHMSVRRNAHVIEFAIAAIAVVVIAIGSFMYDLMRAHTLPTPPAAPPKVVRQHPPPPPPPPPPPGGAH